MSKPHKKLYNYAGTLNYDEECKVAEFEAFLGEWATYCVYGREVAPTTGQKHLQVFAQSYKMLRSLTNKKNIHKLAGCHLAECYAPAEKNKAYCEKDGNFKVFGTYQDVGRGARNDLKEMIEDIKKGMSEDEIMLNYPGNYVRYSHVITKLLNRARSALIPIARAAPRKVHLLYGPTGSGKTTKAVEMFKDVKFYRLANMDNTMWWNNYDGEDYVLLDDYKGGMKLNTLLGILDPWFNTDVAIRPAVLTRFACSNIVITSTLTPQEWYPNQDVSELLRRITTTTKVEKK